MGAKNKRKKPGKPGKPAGNGNDFRGAEFRNSQVLGQGTMAVKTYVQQYAPVPTATDALPEPPSDFTGREEDLAFVLGVLDPQRPQGVPAVAVLSGWGGVGKTTLVRAAGHAAQKNGWFTGALVVDLRGYDAHPAQAEDALEALLRSLGVRPENLPPPGAGREGLYRSQLNARQENGERLLVVADNASALAQVRPLLPPGHHGMLVTSRHSLPGLGRMRTVNRLQPEEAVALLDAALKGNDPDDRRVEEEADAAERVALACGYLPLALQITAALLAQDPDQPLEERAEALGRPDGVLDGLNDGERSLRATFDQSLDRLTPQEQDLFRLLSLNPGPDMATAAVVALADQPQPAVERLLGRLAATHLIERHPTVRGRWQMHDLLRAYAQEQAQAVTERGRAPRRRYEQACERLIGHYVRDAVAADTHFQPPGKVRASRFADRGEALVWFDAERENLIAAAHTSLQAGADLGFALGRYLSWRHRLQDLLVIRSLGLDATKVLGETANEAGAWYNLGEVLRDLRRFDEALAAHETARDLSQRTGVTAHEANAWNGLGAVFGDLRRFDEALAAHETARDLFQGLGDINGMAKAGNNIGVDLRELRRFDEALAAHEAARDLAQRVGDTSDVAHAWDGLGSVLRELRRFGEAMAAIETARDLFRGIGDTIGVAAAWNNLGLVMSQLRRFDDSLAAHETARDSFQRASSTHGEAIAWNNIGVACRSLEQLDAAVTAGQKAAAMLVAAQDWFRTGEAWGELAVTLAASGADLGKVRAAWGESAAAYERADAREEAAVSRAKAAETEEPGSPAAE
ncbi:tetratricopeptide repeat protein [Streptomyces sp. NPDC060184]|uniref:tetratricopeptide repeat protein n=1 Tax=Streptomyces sp. NPDC060184 TaxID=3347064 RepID=UPI00364D2D8F